MTTSVCMGTYNGEKYIEEQLSSILNQTLKPDEVILCDDGSSDNTILIIRDFIARNSLEGTWKLFVNERNKGYPECYYHVMGLCSQDIVFLADQDDIWDEKKLEKMCNVFLQEESAVAVACKFGLIGGEGQGIHTVMAPTRSGESGRLRKVSVHDVFYKGEWPGMVLAYRRAWCSGWMQEDYDILPHDLLISVRAAEDGGFWQLDEELAWHRRHESNTAQEEHRIVKLLDKGRKLQEIENYVRYLEIFYDKMIMLTEAGKKALEKKRKAMKDRQSALLSGKYSKVVQAAWCNRDNVRLATVTCDLLICRQEKRS